MGWWEKMQKRWIEDTRARAGKGCVQLNELKLLGRIAVKLKQVEDTIEHNRDRMKRLETWQEQRYRAWCKKKRRRFDEDAFDEWKRNDEEPFPADIPPGRAWPFPNDDLDLERGKKMGIFSVSACIAAMEAPAFVGCDHHWEPWRVRRDRICAYCGASESKGREAR